MVETLREAVSSTELLHERAMERFYRAVAAEEASELAKRKNQLERKTGELATTTANKTGTEDIISLDSQRSSFKRRLSNPNVPSSNLITWQSKKNRRRLSDSQTETVKAPQKLLAPTTFLLDVEARSDPNLPSDSESPIATQWGLENKPLEDTPLRRWHDTNVSLVEEKQEEKSIAWQAASNEAARIEEPPRDQIPPTSQPGTKREEKQEEEEEEEEESVESSEESSEEVSSADSEDLKLLKARILARQVLDEEDTYHPRGKPILHVETESSSQPARSIVSPSTVVPKSILKKPKEEPIPVNSFGRPVPPEKPIRRSLPPNVHPLNKNEEEEEKKEEGENEERQVTPEPARVPVMSESDTDSVLSAGEAAKNRRIQAKMRTATPEEEVDEEDIEARMAVVNHYTEIVREHSSLSRYQNYHRSSEERRQFGENSTGSRRSSISDDQEASNRGRDRFERQNVEGRIVKRQQEERQQMKGSRGTTPARDTKEKRPSRPSSRNQSPVSRSRNVSTERGGVSSRSSSKSRARAPSQDRRPPSRTGSEEQRFVREWSVEEGGGRRSRRSSSKTPSRSSSRDRNRAGTPVESKMERLQKALESKKYRSHSRRGSSSRGREYSEKAWRESRLNEEQLAIEAKHNVRSMVEYITDLTLLLAAVYVYLFKKETLAIPFIALLFYRRIQHEIKGRVSRGWWLSKRNS